MSDQKTGFPASALFHVPLELAFVPALAFTGLLVAFFRHLGSSDWLLNAIVGVSASFTVAAALYAYRRLAIRESIQSVTTPDGTAELKLSSPRCRMRWLVASSGFPLGWLVFFLLSLSVVSSETKMVVAYAVCGLAAFLIHFLLDRMKSVALATVARKAEKNNEPVRALTLMIVAAALDGRLRKSLLTMIKNYGKRSPVD